MAQQKPIYSSEDEMRLMAQLWSPTLKDDPEKFVLFTYPWGKKGTPLEHFAGPRKWQRLALRRITAHIAKNRGNPLNLWEVLRLARVSGRGVGKSALVSWLVNWFLTCRIGSTVIVSANTEPQLRKVTWGELSKWFALSINAHWWEVNATSIVPAQWLADLVERDLKIGTRYWGAEGKLWTEENPDAYAGPHNMLGMLIVFDEASGIPDAIWSVALGFLTDQTENRFFFAFGNGRRNTGYFFDCFGSKSDFWETEHIDGRDVEGTDKAYYDGFIREFGADSDEAAVEVYGQFPKQGEGQFISPEVVRQATKRERHKDMHAPIVLGVDPARGGDYTVISVRRGRDLLKQIRHRDADTMIVVGQIIEAIEEWAPALTVIDQGGLGYGILDRLVEQHYPVRGVNFGWKSSKPRTWGDKRAEIWGAMREWLKDASIPDEPRLVSDLVQPLKKPDSSGTIWLETKDQMRTRLKGAYVSPDFGDSLAVTFAYPLYNRSAQVDSGDITIHSEGDPAPLSWMGA